MLIVWPFTTILLFPFNREDDEDDENTFRILIGELKCDAMFLQVDNSALVISFSALILQDGHVEEWTKKQKAL